MGGTSASLLGEGEVTHKFFWIATGCQIEVQISMDGID